MRCFLLLAVIILAQLSASCSGNVNCVEPEVNTSYTFIPESGDPEACKSSTPILVAEALKCKHGGKVVLDPNLDPSDSQPSKVVTAAEAEKHAKDSGHLITGGGDHDEGPKNLSAKEQADILETIPAHIKPTWLEYKPKNKYNPNGIDFGPNGCGIWATTVCDRILGLEKGPLTQAEWDRTYADLGSFHGITFFQYISSYYQRKGFCSETKPMEGYKADYVRMKDSLAKGCDVKLFFARKASAWFLPSSNPHIETVFDVIVPDNSSPYLHTNSWGAYAKVAGGWCTEFEHERNHIFGKTHIEDKENFAWPANDARVWVQTTCQCEDMPNLKELLAQ